MRADSAVEPTRSENITVTWRRSAVSRCAEGATGSATGLDAAISLPFSSLSCAIADDGDEVRPFQVLLGLGP